MKVRGTIRVRVRVRVRVGAPLLWRASAGWLARKEYARKEAPSKAKVQGGL